MSDDRDAMPELPGGRGAARGPARVPARGRRAARVPFAVLLLGLLVGGLSLLLLLNTASAANELSRHDLAVQDASVAAQVQQLQNEVAASAAPSNLAKAAEGLGMVPAGNPAFLVVGADGKVVLRGSAAPASAVAVAVPPAKSAKKSAATSSAKASPTTSTSATSAAKTSTAARKSPATASPTARRTPTATPTHAARSPKPSTSTRPGGTR